ncbi:unnamed protein product [Caenorhabditis brenneri]
MLLTSKAYDESETVVIFIRKSNGEKLHPVTYSLHECEEYLCANIETEDNLFTKILTGPSGTFYQYDFEKLEAKYFCSNNYAKVPCIDIKLIIFIRTFQELTDSFSDCYGVNENLKQEILAENALETLFIIKTFSDSSRL